MNPVPLKVSKTSRKPPVVRHTLTSKYRMLKANPLLAKELAKKVAPSETPLIKPLKTLVKMMEDRSERSIRRGSEPPITFVRRGGPTKKLQPLPKQGILTGIKEVTIPKRPSHRVTFITPNNNKRNSILLTSSLSTPSEVEMSRRLSNWLIKHGKAMEDYTHLKCFGVNCQKRLFSPIKIKDHILYDHETENKENREALNDTFLIEDLVEPDPVAVKNLENIASDALLDLHRLILDGYPPEQCEIWLKLIKQNYKKLEDEAQYWECRAALEQCKGNINSAVEYCKTAIIQGAEVQAAEAFLEQLLQKFSLLNIGSEMTEKNKNREKIVQDARSIFKSSIIQFAVQERKLKKKSTQGTITVEKTLVATPVRRSTRLSRSAFTSTPSIQIYSSLKELDDSIRENLKFENNNAIKD